ncbi:MAG: patatin-like phospholipase family protein [Asgard group archaeon]|nr:patatin-like phospholipase family protein [Asgard group archaeon]
MSGYSFGKKTTAFVFSGGASLGSVELGALKALVEEGIQADMVLGTSVGSLNGAMYAYDPTMNGVKFMEKIWHTIKARNVFTPSPLTPVFNITTFGLYLISPKNLRKMILENMPFTRLEETKLPLYIIGTDIKDGTEVVFNKGLALEALMSSVAIPGVFPPQRMAGHSIVDGGIVNNAPISTAVRLGAERVVVFPIGVPSPDQEPKTVAEVLIRSFIFLLNRQLASDIQIYKKKVELIVVPPPDRIDVGPHDFSKSKLLIDQSYTKAKEWLKEDGFYPNVDTFNHPCCVHTPAINFVEATIPEAGPKATTRVKETVSRTSKTLDKKLTKKSEEFKKDLISVKDEIKEKLLGKKKDEEKE